MEFVSIFKIDTILENEVDESSDMMLLINDGIWDIYWDGMVIESTATIVQPEVDFNNEMVVYFHGKGSKIFEIDHMKAEHFINFTAFRDDTRIVVYYKANVDSKEGFHESYHLAKFNKADIPDNWRQPRTRFRHKKID